MDTTLRELLAEVFELKVEDLNETLTKEQIDSWDSLRQMDLVVSIENKYDIELTIDDIIKMDSITTIKEVVESKTR